MKLKAFIFSFLIIFGQAAFAQKPPENFKLTGFVSDEATGKGLLAATVSVLKRTDNKTLAGSTTNEKGNFTVENIPESIVRVRLSMLGYQTVVIDSVDLSQSSRLGLIKLKSAAIVMPEIVIKSLKPMIEFQADRQILNIDRLPGSSGSVTETLRNSGVVEVDPQSNKISVHGQNVKIQMDGHESDMPDDMLSQLPASTLEQIEVITSPGAKESAEGGTYIINLVSKKNYLDSFSGSVNLNAGSNKNSGGGLNLNYKKDRLNVFTQAFANYFEPHGINESESFNDNSQSFYHQLSSGINSQKSPFGYAKLGFDYDFNESNSMTLYGTLFMFNFNAKSNQNFSVMNHMGQPMFGYTKEELNDGGTKSGSFYGFYKKKFKTKGHELTFDALYTTIDNPQESKLNLDYSSRPAIPELQKTNTRVNSKVMIFKTDYALPIEKGRLEAGYSFTYRDRQSDYDALNYSYLSYDWKDSLGLSNDFRYKESINALYSTFSYKAGKFNIKGGLRMENLNAEGNQLTTNTNFSNNFLNFFPNLSLSYVFNDLLNLGFTTFRRVTYPPIIYINSFRRYQEPNSYFAGNPKLQPYFVNSYAVNLSQFINVFYLYTTGSFTGALATENDSILVQSYINLNKSKTFGLDLTLPYYNSPNMPLHLPEFITTLNLQLHFLSKKQSGYYINEDLSMTENSYTMNANLGLKLWYDMDMNFSFYYKPPTKNRIAYNGVRRYLSVFLSKSFMDNKLKMNITISNPLDWRQNINESFGSNYYSRSNYMLTRNRSISLGFTYMFNDYKDRHDRNLDDGRETGGGN